jgi:hypothetical protein
MGPDFEFKSISTLFHIRKVFEYLEGGDLTALNPRSSLQLCITHISVKNKEAHVLVQGGAVNCGLFLADPPPSLLGAVSGKISKIH